MAQSDSSYRNVMGGKLQLKGDLLPTINKTYAFSLYSRIAMLIHTNYTLVICNNNIIMILYILKIIFH